ncbi:hypothetical protein, partial [Sinorhizobium meliloti]|uniref:hypothetical protein n=1 Tax=Rhizobium meliloti TaxID=382 RepID=UPI002090D33C
KIITQCSGHIPSDKPKTQEGTTERSEKESSRRFRFHRTRSSVKHGSTAKGGVSSKRVVELTR